MPIIRISQDSPLTIEIFDEGGGEPACSFTCGGAPSLKGKWKAKQVKGGSGHELFDITGPVAVEIEIRPGGGGGGGGGKTGGAEETSY